MGGMEPGDSCEPRVYLPSAYGVAWVAVVEAPADLWECWKAAACGAMCVG